ncbi:hypothetical protein IV62_GL000458 [Lactobacillus helveticus]|nr:hypothetical protein IV62_GL000458 [Lactobacillus helveticus]
MKFASCSLLHIIAKTLKISNGFYLKTKKHPDLYQDTFSQLIEHGILIFLIKDH